MTENETLSRIELSKRNLAAAFEKLESVIDECIKNNNSLNANKDEAQQLKNELAKREEEHNKISLEYQEILKKYYKAQTTSTEVAEELGSSIDFIEKLLEKANAHN